jgi:regulatory protein
MLARRALTKAEVTKRLAARTSEGVRAAALGRLEQLGVLDDRALALRYARDALTRRSLGRHRIHAELTRRGIPADVVAEAIECAVDHDSERAVALAVLERFRARHARRDDDEKARPAAFRHLVGRGFPAALVRDLLAISL